MYAVKHIEKNGLRFLELQNPYESSRLSICLDQGGRLDELVLKNTSVLADFSVSDYQSKYQSAILFPFVGRIKDGRYHFNDENYQLTCNEVDKNNALHGLVYNKKFEYVKSELKNDIGIVVLRYRQTERQSGFPFKYTIELIYELRKDNLSLKLSVKNEDVAEFPFSLGWHPYFKSSNLDCSHLYFDSDEKFIFDERLVPEKRLKLKTKMPFEFKNIKLDDCYLLKSNKVHLFTPDYQLKLIVSSKKIFLQLYTPERQNTIAIEPMTGPANNFNNKINLKVLKPNEIYVIEWTVSIHSIKKETN
ncbi:aldose 1-epimerase [Winogradskyella sp. A3E31]|uniref:aldose 1-epimerase n=1 Tax=Winogradskyella sp. A3E31 TaxID=3349637 RepID=UPI00398AFD3C